MARALAAPLSVLLLDEPTAGMGSNETKDVEEMIGSVTESYGAAVLLIAHDVELVTRASQRVTVLDFGRVIADGSPDEIRHSLAVIDAYLGRDDS
jgi:branched-chain amino acid transport system ATP-binding protein